MPQAHKHAVTASLLRRYFPSVKDLKGYLTEIIEDNAGATFSPLNASDSLSYRDLLDTSFVALKSYKNQEEKRFTVFPAMTDMREVIDRAHERLFKGKYPQNIIATGYRITSKASERGKKGISQLGISNYFLNTIVTALQTPHWDLLLQRIGEDAMLHLLTETAIFVALPNGCLCQMTGEPIIYMLPSTIESLEENILNSREHSSIIKKRRMPASFNDDCHPRPVKRRKLTRSSPDVALPSKSINPQKTPADILLTRSRLFYSRPNYVPQTNQIIVGLPHKHILNRLEETERKLPVKRSSYSNLDSRILAEKSRHLAKYIFPRQFGISSFCQPSDTNLNTSKFYGNLDREAEIKALGSCSTPRRLKHILPLVEKILWRHVKCGYKPLRNITCSSKLSLSGNKELDSSVILEAMSEQSIHLRSQGTFQGSASSNATFSRAPDATQASVQAKTKARFLDYALSFEEVFRYVSLVTKAVIPKAFWGCESNFKLVMQRVKELIIGRRYENLSLHYVLQGFQTSACDWLMPANAQARVSVSDAIKRRELLEEFMFWYFDSFVIPLLKTTFYITDSTALRNQVLYFRQDDWETMCAPLLERLAAGTFQQISQMEAAEILQQRKLGYSFVRLSPKETGVRPIVNLRRKMTSSDQSINQVLQAAFHILNYERNNQKQLVGAAVFSTDDIYEKIKSFKARLPRDPKGCLPRLYFVKVDVQACFDTIEQTKLIEVLQQLISEDAYMIQRYGHVSMSAGRVKRTYAKRAVPDDDHPHFLKTASDLASVLRNTIFVDQVKYSYSKKEEILRLLEEHITENIVKIGQNYYRQVIGIPQGSIISTLLCTFFYGDLEKRFEQYTADSESLLLRLVDDYLYITTSVSRARSFLDMMSKGHPEYGCFISKEKTCTNFDYDIEVMNFMDPRSRSFLWCGLAIDVNDLSISVDYSRYQTSGIANSLTVDKGRRPGASFLHKMFQTVKVKNHIIYFDTELNTQHVIYMNIFQNFLQTAMKMRIYLKEWNGKSKGNADFITSTIDKTISYYYSCLRVQERKHSVKWKRALSGVNRLVVTWLGYRAFHTVLNCKAEQYAAILKHLSSEISRPRYGRMRRRYRSVVEEGIAGMLHVINSL